MLTRRGPLYFLHIPKTAGSAFTEYLDANVGREDILPHRTWNQVFQNMSDVAIERSRLLLGGSSLVRGHFGASALAELPASSAVVTVLRHPVDRLVSQYNHMRRDPFSNNWAPPAFVESMPPVEDVAAWSRGRAFFSDVQTRYLACDVDVRELWLKTPSTRRSEWFYDSLPAFVCADRGTAASRRLIRVALRRLSRMAVVGVQDMLQETMLVAAHRLGLAPGVALDGLMSAPAQSRRPDVPSATALARINSADSILYQAARARLTSDYLGMARELLRDPGLPAKDLLENRRVVNEELHSALAAEGESRIWA